jgi:hypothetical protein
VLDCLREVRPPFSPERVCSEFASTLKSYDVTKIFGDRFAGAFPIEQFRQFGITLDHEGVRPKSDLYVDLLPLINSGRIELLDNARLISQLCALERRTTRGGRDAIDHPGGGHDDVANACAGAAALVLNKPDVAKFWRVMGGGPDAVDDDVDDWRSKRFAEQERRHPPTMTAEEYARWSAPGCLMPREYRDAEGRRTQSQVGSCLPRKDK